MSEEQVNLAAVVPVLMPSSLAKCGVGILRGRRGQKGRSNKLEQEDDDVFRHLTLNMGMGYLPHEVLRGYLHVFPA